jgi:acetyltransferase-like isoleucine patch superfamily enzyme
MIFHISSSLREYLKKILAALSNRVLEYAYQYRANEIINHCASVGSGVRFRMPVTVYHPERLSLDDQVDIGEYVLIRATGRVVIGNRVLIASHTVINSSTHLKTLPRFGVTVESPIYIHDDVWIGAGVLIMPDVIIGRGAIVGAGAVVTKSVGECSIVAGIPARVIGCVPYGDEKITDNVH